MEPKTLIILKRNTGRGKLRFHPGEITRWKSEAFAFCVPWGSQFPQRNSSLYYPGPLWAAPNAGSQQGERGRRTLVKRALKLIVSQAPGALWGHPGEPTVSHASTHGWTVQRQPGLPLDTHVTVRELQSTSWSSPLDLLVSSGAIPSVWASTSTWTQQAQAAQGELSLFHTT